MTSMIRGVRHSFNSSQNTAMPLSITRSQVMASTCFIAATQTKAFGLPYRHPARACELLDRQRTLRVCRASLVDS